MTDKKTQQPTTTTPPAQPIQTMDFQLPVQDARGAIGMLSETHTFTLDTECSFGKVKGSYLRGDFTSDAHVLFELTPDQYAIIEPLLPEMRKGMRPFKTKSGNIQVHFAVSASQMSIAILDQLLTKAGVKDYDPAQPEDQQRR